jgi:inosine/xanthosine triphosphate pyrophosphatase family protein
MDAIEKNGISHRGRALAQLKKYLLENGDKLREKYGE